MTSIILASPCDDRETLQQASSAYSMPHTARRTWSIAGSGPIDVGGSFRCTSSARMAGSSLNLWTTTASTAAKKMLNNSGDSTHPTLLDTLLLYVAVLFAVYFAGIRCCYTLLYYFKKNHNAPRLSEHPPVRGGEMSKRLGGIKEGCKYKTSSWHLNGFPDGNVIICCCC